MPQRQPGKGGGKTSTPTDPFAPAIARGIELHRTGKTRDAGLLFQKILSAAPDHPEASHRLALVLHELGESETAERLLAKAILQQPRRAALYANHATILLALGRAEEAAEQFRKATRLAPDAAQLQAGLAAALLALDRPQEAAQAARRALARQKDLAAGHAQLARALVALAQPAEALARFDQAIASAPEYPEAHIWRADLLAAQDRQEEAVAGYRTAIAVGPGNAAAHLALANALAASGRLQAAADNFRAAAYVKPGAEAYAGLARALLGLDQRAEAAEAAATALRLAPDDAALADEFAALVGAAAPQRALSALEREEAQYRIAIAATPDNPVAFSNLASTLVSQGRLRDAIDCYRQALRLKPDYFLAWSDMLFAINYLGDLPVAEMVAEARRYGAAVAAEATTRRDHANSPDPSRRLKVGLVSPDLRAHPVGRFLDHVLAALDPAAIELSAYFTSGTVDEVTANIRASVPNWREAADWSDDRLEQAILADGVDILIDLSGHTAHNRLQVFARKPAPIAVTWLGYFATTGLAAIDYVLANRWVIPDIETDQWVETPWRLPDTYLCFSPPSVHVPLAPPPSQRNGFLTFGSANNINKLNDATATCWAGVLHQVPQSRLLLRSRPLTDAAVADAVRARFASLGIAPERLLLQGAVNDYAQHLARYNDVDIALDPFPYAGGTTTVEALWMGVPVLTVAGDRYVAHMGESILNLMGMPEWIAADTADYGRRAAGFAADPAALAALRRDLRHRFITSPLADAPRFARHLEQAWRQMWQRWCKDRV